MADKMMRIAGRNKEGLAKGLSVNSMGQAEVVQGSFVLRENTGTSVKIEPGATSVLVETEYIGNLNEVYINTNASSPFPFQIIVEGIIKNENLNLERVVSTYESNGIKNSVELVVPVEAPYVKVTARSEYTTAFYMDAYILARQSNKIEVTNQSLGTTPNVLVLKNQTSTNQKVFSKQTNEYVPTTYVGNANELQLFAKISGNYPYAIIVEEIIKDENHNLERVVKTTTSQTFYLDAEYTQPITAPYVKIYIQSKSVSDFNLGLYAIAKKKETLTGDGLLDSLSNLVQSINNKIENPLPDIPVVSNVKILSTDAANVVNFKDGKFYGVRTTTIMTSVDGVNWETLATIPSGSTMDAWIQHLVVTDTGRIIVTTAGGDIWVSDESGQFDTQATYVTGGKYDKAWGSTHYGDLIAFSNYDPHGGEGAYKVMLSRDNGETFQEIMNQEKLLQVITTQDNRYHLHDVEYDVLSGRLFVWVGDFGNLSLIYSDDFGANWQLAFNIDSGNSTQLVATKYGLVLGADTYGGGVGFVNIDRSNTINPPITEENLNISHWKLNDMEQRYITGKKWIDTENGFYLLPARAEYDDTNTKSGYIAWSPNGRDWFIIHHTRGAGHYVGLETIVYGNGKLVGGYNLSDGSKKTFVADMKLKA